jgi:16S rRNA (adenine1518-N6/adenine1519-N6)-dimethyltransferase
MSRSFSTHKNSLKGPRKEGILPNKTLGQNFLKDQNYVKKIIEAADLKKDETVLEIGPGMGAITVELAKRAGQVIAVEKDREMAAKLKASLADANIENVQIITGDILELFKKDRLAIRGLKKYKVVANIPYYLTSFLIRNLLEIKNGPEDIFLMIQKEVGQRICSRPPQMNLLSVSVGYYAVPKILFKVSKNSFYPRPKIDSVFIRITPKGIEKNSKFFEIVKAGFSHPRKQLLNNLSGNLSLSREEIEKWLESNGIKPERRAETISLEQWEELFASFPYKEGKE